MICKSCRSGADLKADNPLAIIAKIAWHKKCKGNTWCDCQCRVKK